MRLRKGETPLVATAGLMLFVQIALFNTAIHWSNASHSMLMICTHAFWVALIEHYITKKDQLTLRKIQGMVLAIIGVVIALAAADSAHSGSENIESRDAASLAGDLLMLLSAIILAIKVAFTKYAVAQVHPSRFIFWHHVFGTVCFVIYCATFYGSSDFHWEALGASAVLGLMYQGIVVGGICFAIQANLLKRHSATQLAVFGFATPLAGVVLAIVFRNDPMSLWLILSGTLVVAGIYLVNTARQRT